MRTNPLATSISDEEIENLARSKQLELWARCGERCSIGGEVDYAMLLNPARAMHELEGLVVLSDSGLGEMRDDGKRVQVAGVLDLEHSEVRVSPNFSYVEQRFTLAHEFGHIVLGHHGLGTLHRDRSVSGPLQRRNRKEYEADRFATHFLMPQKAVRQRFVEKFGVSAFELTDATAFALCTTSEDAVRRRYRSTRDLSRALATSASFGGNFEQSLCEQFMVSPGAMAIRLDELGLVRPL